MFRKYVKIKDGSQSTQSACVTGTLEQLFKTLCISVLTIKHLPKLHFVSFVYRNSPAFRKSKE